VNNIIWKKERKKY